MDARENILLIRLKSIGDILFTLPAVNAVRENFSSAKITFITSKKTLRCYKAFALDEAALRSGKMHNDPAQPQLYGRVKHLN